MADPDTILATYDRVGPAWDRARSRRLTEQRWLDRMLAITPNNTGRRRILDLGCGSGRPIAAYLADRGGDVTGVDGAASMAALFAQNLPRAAVLVADMRGLSLGRRFDALLAWDSFFHLAPDDQRAMFATFAAHADPGAALMFTSGPTAGERDGSVAGEVVYHASLAPAEYRKLLAENGFSLRAYTADDPDCAGHTVWLARFTGG